MSRTIPLVLVLVGAALMAYGFAAVVAASDPGHLAFVWWALAIPVGLVLACTGAYGLGHALRDPPSA